jgi:hypothetical protein
VSSTTNMKKMFAFSDFNGDISKWKIKKVLNMDGMFWESSFCSNISPWLSRNKRKNVREYLNGVIPYLLEKMREEYRDKSSYYKSNFTNW